MLDPLGPIEVVCVAEGNVDPAIDVATSNLEEYARTRNPKHLRFKHGMRPTVYVLRPLKAMYVLDKLNNMPPSSRAALAFSVACHEVRLSDGEILRPGRFNADPMYGVEVAADDWIDRVAAKRRLASIAEMGLFAVRRASLTPEELGPFFSLAGASATPSPTP
jgi:hypothetical protein